jgi:hypothetical protein
MLIKTFSFVFPLLITLGSAGQAAESSCTQQRIDGTTLPSRTWTISPAREVLPFYQWENDNGYCGEVSMIRAGLSYGQWMSQFNARKVCGASLPPPETSVSLSQSGPDGWCHRNSNFPNYNAQLLIEDPGTDVAGPNPFANVAACLANSRLSGSTYPYWKQRNGTLVNQGLNGYRDYMSWVKREVIAKHHVTLGIFLKNGSDPQYDHEVSVVGILTDHNPADATYYDDDVLVFEDHGAYQLPWQYKAIPAGASNGCTPYIFGYTFGSLPRSRSDANAKSSPAYSILIPGVYPTYTSTGGDGYLGTTAIIGHNYAFSITGPMGSGLLPVQLTIPSATKTNGVENPPDPQASWQYENSMIGTSSEGMSCTNDPPKYWMAPLTLQVTVTGLSAGRSYNLYEYDFPGIDGTGASAALRVPTQNFNSPENSRKATRVTTFTARGESFIQTVTTTSDHIVVFRAVPATGP